MITITYKAGAIRLFLLVQHSVPQRPLLPNLNQPKTPSFLRVFFLVGLLPPDLAKHCLILFGQLRPLVAGGNLKSGSVKPSRIEASLADCLDEFAESNSRIQPRYA